ncbi:MAG: hypothetical protein ACOYUZ_02400 [Patescibacteria group bacterium]
MNLNEITIPKWLAIAFAAVPWIICVGFVFFILSLRFPASGSFRSESDLTGTSAFLYQFLPAERAVMSDFYGEDWNGQRIIGDPVYINARTPGPYKTVDVEMEFRVQHQPLLEFGIVHDAAGQQMELIPWYSEVLDNDYYQKVISPGGVKGFVAKGTSSSRLDDPDTRGLAAWLATSTGPAIADAMLSEVYQRFDVSLRGAHDFWVVPANGQIDMRLEVQDVNRNRSGGLLAITISKDGKALTNDAVGTSGSRDEGYGSLVPVRIARKNLEPGIYRIHVVADDDVFIRRIFTKNEHLVIGPRLNIGDVVGWEENPRSFTAWTTARHIVLETFHKEGLQDIGFGPYQQRILSTHTAVRMDRYDAQTEPVQFFSPLGDVRVIADGFFALTPGAFFEPEPRRFTPATNGQAEGIVAVRTDYTKSMAMGDGWLKMRGTFDIPANADNIRFVLSAPGIVSRAGAVDIRRMTLTYHRPYSTVRSWWDVFYAELRNAWHRII